MKRLQNVIGFTLALAMAISFGHVPLFAQFTTASLSGIVSDSTGSAVPEAQVTVENIDTNLRRTVTTGQDGSYVFPLLPIGTYRLSVAKAGFSGYKQEGIKLAVGQAVSQPVTMQVGAVQEQVSVSADAEMLPTESATVSDLIDEKRIVDLPLDGRQAQTLLFLVPGTTDTTTKWCGFNCQGGVYPGAQFGAVNGGGPGNVNYQMDGADHNDNYINTNYPFPNPDAIQEFSVQSANMSAEYGKSAVVVNVVTKSGTNRFHGDAFEFLRNGSLNARNFFAPDQDTLKRNQFGGTFGGPIIKDKLFFFGTYQGTRISSAASGNVAFVPTALERTGDFSETSTPIFDPATHVPFPGNKIPADRLSPPSLFFLNSVPLPNGPNGQLTFLGPTSKQNDDQFMPKVDYLWGKHQISGRYFFTNYSHPADLSLAETNILALDTSGSAVRVQTVAVNDTYTASPSLLFNTWFGYDRSIGRNLGDSPFGYPDAGIKVSVPAGPKSMNGVGVGGYFNFGSAWPGEYNRKDWRFREVVALQKGAHQLRFGGEVFRLMTPQANTYQQTPGFSFSSALSGSNLSDFMLGAVSTFQQGAGVYYNYNGTEGDLFIQDDWRINPKLTVNVGVRWDPYFAYSDSKNRIACYRPGQVSARYPNAPAGLVYGGDSGCPAAGTEGALGNIAPRLGFAYRLGQNTVVRGGGGMYYTLPNTDQINGFTTVAPFAPNFTLNGVDFQDPWGSAGIADPFPASFGGGNVPGPDATYTLPVGIAGVFPPQYFLPTVATWNLLVQRQAGANWLFSVGYVGNAGYHLSSNAVGRQELNPAVYIPGASTVANTQSRRLNPNFSSVQVYPTDFISRYHALQLDVQKRFARGFSLRANYTFSKLTDDLGANHCDGCGASMTNPFDRSFDYGISSTNVPNVFHLSAVWQMPRFTSGRLVGALANGWELSGVTNWRNGFPFTVFSGVDNSFTGVNWGTTRADFTGSKISEAKYGDQAHGQMVQQYFNTSLFVVNAVGTFGNSPLNALQSPGLFNTDFAAMKNFRITEEANVQFRAEFFNIFNNVNFGMPGNVVGTGSYGQLTYAGSPRIVQFGLKFAF